MALGDGDNWDETVPTDATLAVKIDDHNRDLRKGVRGRLALEHEWPASQSATSEAGVHKFVTFQDQGAKPTLAGTQKSAVYTKAIGTTSNALFFQSSQAAEVQITNSAGDALLIGNKLLFAQQTVQAGDKHNEDTTNEQSFATTYDIAADSLAIGDIIRMTFRLHENLISGNGGVTIRVDWDTTRIWETQAMDMTGSDNELFEYKVDAIVISIGASGTIEVQGQVNAGLDGSGNVHTHKALAKDAVVTVDTTQVLTISSSVQFTASGNNFSLEMRHMIVERLR